MQAKTNGDELAAIETYGGVISFNLEECWYAGTLVITSFRRPVVPPPSISRTAGTLTTHTVQALLIRSQAALVRLQAACIRLQAVLIRLQVPRLSVLRAAARAAWLDGRRRCGRYDAGTRQS